MTLLDAKAHLYEDKNGVIHVCEMSEVHRGIRLVWTLCNRDVPANTSFRGHEVPTCAICYNLSREPL